MKIIKYTLTPDGSVPEYVIDGGYFPVENNNPIPQNYTIVGVAIDAATEESFDDEATLLDYLQEKNFIFKNPHTEANTPLEDVVSDMWFRTKDS
jgi:hypothetical protein